MRCSCDQRSIVMLVSSVPLSETIIAGQPRRAMTASSSRATRRPGSDVSATSARHSRVKSSTIARIRNRRPSANASDRKSSSSAGRPYGSAITLPHGPLPPITAGPEAVLTVEAPELLMVHDDAFAPEQDVKPAIAKSPANGCEFTQPHSRRLIVARAIAHRRAV